MIYIITGVSGVGKTTIGILLSQKLKLPFFDADDFHPQENVEKMTNGIPLEDQDRKIWLETLARNIIKWNIAGGAILACSALKEKYREQLQVVAEEETCWVFLHSKYEVILKRIESRKNHYFNPHLLQSQFDTLEFPTYGIHVNVNKSQDKVINEIMDKLKEQKSQIGLLGLGVMGKSLALNLASNKIRVAVFNRHFEILEVDIAKNFALDNASTYNFPWFDDLGKFTLALERPRNILLMVNAGKTVDFVIESLLPFLEPEDLIIDAGNSHYKDTLRRENLLKEKGILFMGTGVSGGEEGARKGPSIMPGGTLETYARVGVYLEKISARDKNNNACCAYIGPGGSGHFVKMLHNGIEYGEMQLIAETYHYLRFGCQMTPEKIADLFVDWNKELQSYLLEISAEILRKKENGNFLIDLILDAAGQKGTGGWSTNAALELGIPFDTITASVMARNISAKKLERTQALELYGTVLKYSDQGNLGDLFSAFKTAGIINHAIGFDLLLEASKSYNWDLNLSEIARIWTNGCIIRSALMESMISIYKEQPTKNMLLHPQMIETLKNTKSALINTTASAMHLGCPMPVMSAAANYFLNYTSGQSSANMIQAQRDYFGAHTYERVDKERGTFFHTQWKPAN